MPESNKTALLPRLTILCLLLSTNPVNAQAFKLSDYKVETVVEMNSSLGEFSGLTWDKTSRQLLVATVKKKYLIIKNAYLITLNDNGIKQGPMKRLRNTRREAIDVEGISSINGNKFAFIEETGELLTFAELADGILEPAETIDIGALGITGKSKNRGPEAVAYSGFLNELRILLESKEMFILNKTGEVWGVDRICESFDEGKDWAGMAAIPDTGHWLVLSEQSRSVYEIDDKCKLVDKLDLDELKSAKPFTQPEGIAIDDELNLYIVSEPGSGSRTGRSRFFKLVMH